MQLPVEMLNKSPGSSAVSTAATGFEGKLEKQTL